MMGYAEDPGMGGRYKGLIQQIVFQHVPGQGEDQHIGEGLPKVQAILFQERQQGIDSPSNALAHRTAPLHGHQAAFSL